VRSDENFNLLILRGGKTKIGNGREAKFIDPTYSFLQAAHAVNGDMTIYLIF